MNIREADPDDAAALADIQIASYRTAYAAWMPADYLARFTLEEETQDWLDLMSDPDRGDVLLVAEREGVLVGYALGRLITNSEWQSELVALHVRSTHQRVGVGRMLIASMAQRLQSLGASSLMLTTARENLNARRIYERLGGRYAGEFVNVIGEDTSVNEAIYGWPDIAQLKLASGSRL